MKYPEGRDGNLRMQCFVYSIWATQIMPGSDKDFENFSIKLVFFSIPFLPKNKHLTEINCSMLFLGWPADLEFLETWKSQGIMYY